MEQSTSEVVVCHLQGVVHRPERRRESVTDTWETTARRGVGLEHHKFLACCGDSRDRGKVLGKQVRGGGVREVVGENILRVYRVAETGVGESGSTVVVGIPRIQCSEYGTSMDVGSNTHTSTDMMLRSVS